MSNYDHLVPRPEVREAEFDGLYTRDDDLPAEVMCHRCYGTGLVEVHGQETDCIECEGFGTVVI